MPPSFRVLVDTTTQSPWLRVWTAACLVLQDTTVRRRGWPKCLENARLVSKGVCLCLFFFPPLSLQRYNHSSTVQFLSVLCANLFVSRGQPVSPKQSGRLGAREPRVHIKHETSQLNSGLINHYLTLLSLQKQELLDELFSATCSQKHKKKNCSLCEADIRTVYCSPPS